MNASPNSDTPESVKSKQLVLKTNEKTPAVRKGLNQSWEVHARGKKCASTGAAFEDGAKLVSRISEQTPGVREDYLATEWSDELRDGSLYYWQTEFRVPPPKKEEPFREENAETAFREMLEKADTKHINTLFILAVMLERKRLFIERAVQKTPDGKVMRIYEHKDTAETFIVHDPELGWEDIEAVQLEVAGILGWLPEEGAGEVDSGEENVEGSDHAEPEDLAPDDERRDSAEEDSDESDENEDDEFGEEEEGEFEDDEEDD